MLPTSLGTKASIVVVALVIICLPVGPMLAWPDGIGVRAALGLECLVVMPVLGVTFWRRRRQLGYLVTFACMLYSFGLALTSLHLVIGGATALWYLGHVVWVVATPILGAGMARSRSTSAIHPFAFTLLLVDAAMTACAWLTMLWRQYLRTGQVGLFESGWAELFILGISLYVLCMLVLVSVVSLDLGVMCAALGLLALTISDVFVAQGLMGVLPHGGAGFLLLFTWPLVLASAWLTMDRRDRRPADQGAEQRAGLTTLVNVLVPVGIAFGGLAATLEADRITILLVGVVIVIFGVRELIRARQSADLVRLLAEQAMHDPLTGLANRRALGERLKSLAATTTPVTVLTLDVDRFKQVNTSFGHSIGDDVLAAVGDALRETCGPLAARAYRLGGDEFAVVAVGDSEIGLMLADRVRAAVVDYTNRVPGVENIGLTASVGVAPLTREGDPLAVLGRAADALRVAKQDRNRVRVYTEELLDEANRRTRLETRLRSAIDRRTLRFHYQPIVDLRSGRIMAMESLARWDDEELGAVSPTDFVPMAEQTGLIHDLGRLAIDSALRVVGHADNGPGRLSYVAVNVSPLQLRRPQFVDEVAGLVREHDARPSMLKLEVTEGIFMDTDDPAVENLRRLSSLGIGIAIDDFGSGYSSLGYMSRLPIETVKVDRVLTSQVEDSRTRSVVKALVWVAEAHGLQVILEGVETEQTAATLRRLGVRWGQGWLWSRAVPEDEVCGVLADLGTLPPMTRRADTNLARLNAAGSIRVSN
ncbi:MAG: putative bifunctional diguanylate cyclase/phosphodiesterase [Actinomycetales bacterium]